MRPPDPISGARRARQHRHCCIHGAGACPDERIPTPDPSVVLPGLREVPSTALLREVQQGDDSQQVRPHPTYEGSGKQDGPILGSGVAKRSLALLTTLRQPLAAHVAPFELPSTPIHSHDLPGNLTSPHTFPLSSPLIPRIGLSDSPSAGWMIGNEEALRIPGVSSRLAAVFTSSPSALRATNRPNDMAWRGSEYAVFPLLEPTPSDGAIPSTFTTRGEGSGSTAPGRFFGAPVGVSTQQQSCHCSTPRSELGDGADGSLLQLTNGMHSTLHMETERPRSSEQWTKPASVRERCPFCHANVVNLRRHKKTDCNNPGRKPRVRCDGCGSTFTRSNALKRHQRGTVKCGKARQGQG